MDNSKPTKENGAIVSALGQFYMHSLPRSQEEIINDMLRDYKKCKIEFTDELETGVQILFTDLEVYGQKKERKDKFNRAREKEDARKEIERGFSKWRMWTSWPTYCTIV